MMKSRYFNIAILLLGAIGGAGCAFLLQIFLARILTTNDFGVFSTTLALVMLLSPIAHWGLGQYLLKESSNFPDKIPFILKPISMALGIMSIIACIIFWMIGFYLEKNGEINWYFILFMTGHIFAQLGVEVLVAIFQIKKKNMNLSILQAIHHVIRLVLVVILFVIMDASGLVIPGTAYFITGILLFLYMVYTMIDFYRNSDPGSDILYESIIGKRKVIAEAMPYGISTLAYFLYFQSDVFLIGFLSNVYSAGIYSTAFTIMTATYLIPAVIFDRYFLPHFHRLVNSDKKYLYNFYLRSTTLLFIAGIVFSILIWFLGQEVVMILFGEKYNDSLYYLRVLSMGAPFMFASYCAGALLATGNNAKYKLYVMLFVATFNVVTNMIFIPYYSAIAAAWSTVLSQILLSVLFSCVTWHRLFKNV